MTCQYAATHYNVPACIGRRVVVNGKPGVIAKDLGHHIGVLFDDCRPGDIRPCHPTWEVTYLEMGAVRQPTKAQARYREWQKCSDCFDSFRDFLMYCTERDRRRKEGTWDE